MLYTLTGMGSTALAAAVTLPRVTLISHKHACDSKISTTTKKRVDFY